MIWLLLKRKLTQSMQSVILYLHHQMLILLAIHIACTLFFSVIFKKSIFDFVQFLPVLRLEQAPATYNFKATDRSKQNFLVIGHKDKVGHPHIGCVLFDIC